MTMNKNPTIDPMAILCGLWSFILRSLSTFSYKSRKVFNLLRYFLIACRTRICGNVKSISRRRIQFLHFMHSYRAPRHWTMRIIAFSYTWPTTMTAVHRPPAEKIEWRDRWDAHVCSPSLATTTFTLNQPQRLLLYACLMSTQLIIIDCLMKHLLLDKFWALIVT